MTWSAPARNASVLSCAAAIALALGACGGSSGPGVSATALPSADHSPGAPTVTASSAAAGVWEGSVTSTVTGRTVPVLGMVDATGTSTWMMADGRVFGGAVPASGTNAAQFVAHMHESARFPNGTAHGAMTMVFESMRTDRLEGRYSGLGDEGPFHAAMSAVSARPASLATLAGTYTRSTSGGYTMTMAIDSQGRISASDSRGCLISGTTVVPDTARNLYRMQATVSSCGRLDGAYTGMGTLTDADAMRAWSAQMVPLMHGGARAGMPGGTGMGGNMPGDTTGQQNTIPSGVGNLFMFALVNDRAAIMDVLAR